MEYCYTIFWTISQDKKAIYNERIKSVFKTPVQQKLIHISTYSIVNKKKQRGFNYVSFAHVTTQHMYRDQLRGRYVFYCVNICAGICVIKIDF